MFRKYLIVLILLFMSLSGIYSDDKPSVIITDFDYKNVNPDDVEIITEIFRSKLVVSDVYNVLDRKHLEEIIGENKLQASGITRIEDKIEIGQLMNAEYIIVGNLIKLDKQLGIIISMIDVETAEIVKAVETQVPNYDQIYDTLTELVIQLIAESTGRNDFTFNTKTTGFSIEAGLVGTLIPVDNNIRPGLGLSIGCSQQFGDFSLGVYSMWSFSNVTNNALYYADIEYPEDGIYTISPNSFLGFNFIFGDKTTGFAGQVGFGAGYDFALGLNLAPSAGLFFKNFYFRYYPTFNIKLEYDNATTLIHQLEFGYSIFFGTKGKTLTEFR